MAAQHRSGKLEPDDKWLGLIRTGDPVTPASPSFRGCLSRRPLAAVVLCFAVLAAIIAPAPAGASASDDPEVNLEKYTRIDPGGTGDLCETYGKPAMLTLRYLGGNEVQHHQDPGKVAATGDPGATQPVMIIVSEKANGGGKVYFSGLVALGDQFSALASQAGDSALRSEIHVTVLDGAAVLQSIKFHTSCSQPLHLGDRFGSVVLVGFMDQDGGEETLPEPDLDDIGQDADQPTGPVGQVGDSVTWTYLVTATDTVTQPVITDDSGTPGDPSDDFTPNPVTGVNGFNVGDENEDNAINPGEEWVFTYSSTVRIGQHSSLAVLVAQTAASLPQPVTDSDPSHHLGQFQGDLCETYGKPAMLTLRYLGGNELQHHQDPGKVAATGDPGATGPVTIIVSEKANGGGKVYFSDLVALGDQFSALASAAGDSTFRSEIHVTVLDGAAVLQSIKFHTSCSQPLHLGDRFGSVELVDFGDKDGRGPNQDALQPAADLCETYGKPGSLDLQYVGNNVLAHNQDPKKVSATGDPGDVSPVRIKVSEKSGGAGKVYFDGTVLLGDTFTAAAANAGDSSFRSESHVTVLQGATVLQAIRFHTSCSQPLRVDDRFASVVLKGF